MRLSQKQEQAKEDWRLFYWDANNKDVHKAVSKANAEAKGDVDGSGKKKNCLVVTIRHDASAEVEQKIKEFKTALPILVERERNTIKAKKSPKKKYD